MNFPTYELAAAHARLADLREEAAKSRLVRLAKAARKS